MSNLKNTADAFLKNTADAFLENTAHAGSKNTASAHENVNFRWLKAENAEDMARLAALEALSFSTPWSGEQYTAMMRGGMCRVLGAFDGARLLGYVAFAPHLAAGELEIYNIAVAEARRREGLGKRLLALLFELGRANNMERAVLEVRTGNVAAIRLYEGAGFTRCGLRKAYYADTNEDALVYERFFGGTAE